MFKRIVVDVDIGVEADLSDHGSDFAEFNMTAFALECLEQCVLVNEACLEDVQVVEELLDVLRLEMLLGECRGEELRIRDLFVAVQAKLLREQLYILHCQVYFRVRRIDLMDSLEHLVLADSATVV